MLLCCLAAARREGLAKITALEEEKATLVRVVHETEALLAKAKEKGSDTHGKATELAEANERLLRNAQGAAKAAAIAKEAEKGVRAAGF